MEYGPERLKNIVEKEAEEEAKEQQQVEEELAAATEQQQDNDEQYDTVPKIKLVYERKRVKEFRVTNLNGPNTKIIMDNITPHTEMRTKVIYSFKSVINRGAGEIVPYYKTLTQPSGMFTSLEEIQAYIEKYEQKRLDLDNEEIWSKAYLPTERTTEARGNYDGKVIFKHVQIRLVA